MRTTLSIDDDVLQAVKERARYEKRTAGEVVSDLARKGLRGGSVGTAASEPDADGFVIRNGFAVFPRRGGAVVTNELIDRIREEEGI